LQDQLRLLEGILMPIVPQDLKEPEVPRQVDFADATENLSRLYSIEVAQVGSILDRTISS
jgi:hypothetical protein